MSFYNLASSLERLKEDTTMNNISYLPTHFGQTRNALKDLAKIKLDWDIEILEQSVGKEVRFGNALNVSVPNEHWENFLTIFDNCDLVDSRLNLRSLLNEALDDEVRDLTLELKPTLIRAFTNPPFDEIEQDINRWKGRFKVERFLDQNVPVSFDTKTRDLMKLYESLLNSYRDDIGNMEMLIEAFRDKTPLSAFETFKQYDFIYGARVRSRFEGITMLFEATIDMTFVLTETVYIEEQDIVDDIEEADTSIKVVGQIIYPRGERFNRNFYPNLYNIIADIGEKDAENEY